MPRWVRKGKEEGKGLSFFLFSCGAEISVLLWHPPRRYGLAGVQVTPSHVNIRHESTRLQDSNCIVYVYSN